MCNSINKHHLNTAEKHNVSLAAKIPVDPKTAALVDAGKVEDVEIDNLNNILDSIIAK